MQLVKEFFSSEAIITFSYSEKKNTEKYANYQEFISSNDFKKTIPTRTCFK